MTLLSGASALLFLLTAAAYWLVPPRLRSAVLLVASLVFYSSAGLFGLAVVLGLTLFSWSAGRLIADNPTPARLGVAVTVVLATLGVFKYMPMAAQTLNGLSALLHHPIHVTAPAIPMPVGISFIAFALVHFLVEIHDGAPLVGAADFATYVTFFPTVTMGPIKRYRDFVRDLPVRPSPAEDPAAAAEPAPERRQAVSAMALPLPDGPGAALDGSLAMPAAPARLEAEDVRAGLTRITVGLFRKLVVADTLLVFSNHLSDAKAGRGMLAIAILAYTFRIYFDFAGYSDIAIGAARLLGFRIMENFDRPYLTRNISQFWRRWHMTLSTLITQYVFIPLGGSRRGKVRAAANTVFAMLVSGLWHGAAWNFVLWGLYHGIGLALLRPWRSATAALRARLPWFDSFAGSAFGSRLGFVFGWAVTFGFVALGWVLFALPLRQAVDVYGRLLGAAPGRTWIHLMRLWRF